jgi:hypothetical protein
MGAGDIKKGKPVNKEDLLAQIRTDHRQLDRYLFYFVKNEDGEFMPGDRPKFAEREMQEPGVVGEWSLKDLLAHLAAWELHFLDWHSAVDQEASVPIPYLAVMQPEVDDLNRQIYDLNRARSLRDTIAGFRASHARPVGVLAEMSAGELSSREPAGSLRGMTKGEYNDAVTWEHYRWAKGRIRRWSRTRAHAKQDKTSLLKSIRSERRRLEQNLAQLSDEERSLPGVVGEWSVKDLLAHLTAWEQLFLSWYRAGMRGESPEKPAPGYSWRAIDELNRQIFEQNRDRLLEDVVVDFERSYGEVLETIGAIPEEDIYPVGRYPWTGKINLAEYIRANTANHYRWAKGQLRNWVRRRAERVT